LKNEVETWKRYYKEKNDENSSNRNQVFQLEKKAKASQAIETDHAILLQKCKELEAANVFLRKENEDHQEWTTLAKSLTEKANALVKENDTLKFQLEYYKTEFSSERLNARCNVLEAQNQALIESHTKYKDLQEKTENELSVLRDSLKELQFKYQTTVEKLNTQELLTNINMLNVNNSKTKLLVNNLVKTTEGLERVSAEVKQCH